MKPEHVKPETVRYPHRNKYRGTAGLPAAFNDLCVYFGSSSELEKLKIKHHSGTYTDP